MLEYVGKGVEVLRQQNGIICATHPNANIYTMLSSLVEFDGFYLESDPCLVCNNPEVPFAVRAREKCVAELHKIETKIVAKIYKTTKTKRKKGVNVC